MASFARKALGRFGSVVAVSAVVPLSWYATKPMLLDAKPAHGLPSSLPHSFWSSSESLPSQLLKFIDLSPSPYHAVENSKALLELNGFRELSENDEWDITPGGKYFVNRCNTSGSSLTAFAVGSKWKPGNPFSIVATHVDSPCLRLKPHSKKTSQGYQQVAVELYGGGLWHTWHDRDLGCSGRVLVRTGPETIESRLVRIREPLLHIPTLAVHYQKQNPFAFDLRKLVPLLSSDATVERIQSSTIGPAVNADADMFMPGRTPQYWPLTASAFHHGTLVQRIASELQTTPGKILDFDLCLFDVQPSAIGGIHDEFVYASRLDNLMMTFCGLVAFTRSLKPPMALDDESAVRVLSLFDHEEIGSKSSLGASAPFLAHIMQRVCKSSGASDSAYERSVARSFLLSADMTHALHPSHPQWHDSNHSVGINRGLVVSSHPRNSFMKNTPGKLLMQEIVCRASDLTDDSKAPLLQYFTTPNDVSCGSTLGPLLSMQTGMRSLDVGNSQLSMHSTREMAGVWDIANAVAILHGFWRDFVKVDEGIHLG